MTQTPFGAFFFFLPFASSAEDIKKRAFYSTLFYILFSYFFASIFATSSSRLSSLFAMPSPFS